jgi:ribosomal protein L39E
MELLANTGTAHGKRPRLARRLRALRDVPSWTLNRRSGGGRSICRRTLGGCGVGRTQAEFAQMEAA